MRAAPLRQFGAPIAVADVPQPEPGPGEALVRVRATGLCATDVKAWSGALPGLQLPRILGHEVAGEVVRTDTGPSAGSRVACYIYGTCGACVSCRAGLPTGCGSAVRLGLERDGGLAEYVAIPVDQLIELDPEVSFDHAAVAMDAVATSWAALVGAGGLHAGQRVLVVGCGGLGLSAVQIARAHGARIAAMDVHPDKLELARLAGADLAVLADDVAAVTDWADDGIDLALEVSGSRAGFQTAAAVLVPGGTLVCCGYRPGTEYGLDSIDIVSRQLTIRGSRSASRDHAEAALLAVSDGRVVPQIHRVLDLDEVQDGLDELRDGAVAGRLVVHV